MSSYVAAGPIVSLDGPPPRPPRHRLLSVPGVLVEGATLDDFRAGANVYGYPPDKPELWASCEAATFDVKGEGTAPNQPRFYTVSYYLPVMCGTIGNVDFDAFRDRAEAALRATESYAIERILVHGVPDSDTPHLDDGELTILAGGAAVSPGIALSYLDDAIAVSGRAGMIHITRAIANALGVIPVGNDDEPELLFTTAGTPVAIGDGYVGADPDAGAAATGTLDWAFATGPVEVRLSGEYRLGETWAETLDRETNEAVYRVEKDALVTYDGEVQAGVLVDWAT